MSPVIYIKKPPKKKREIKIGKKTERAFFITMSAIGLFAMIFAIYPFLVWQFSTLPKLSAKVKEVPIPQKEVLSVGSALNQTVEVIKDPDGFTYFSTQYKPQGPRPVEFFLTVPKLEIKRAVVKVDNLKFDKHLSHFPGTAIPGEVGNSFITGHSVLPQFADPQDYRAIFTKLPELQTGDQIVAEVAGRRLIFVVQYSKIVDPKDVSVLSPISQNGRNLTLMTCVPPGANLKRLVVVAGLM